jgi:NAD(P)-dependent dehydrogenase (short-subunit alcohol dehydrogenase family)
MSSTTAPTPLTVFISGGNAGLGYETTKTLLLSTSGSSYHIFLGSRSLDKANAAIKELESEAASQLAHSGSRVEGVQIDITNDTSIAQAIQHVKSRVDHIDVLVNNAGKTSTAI